MGEGYKLGEEILFYNDFKPLNTECNNCGSVKTMEWYRSTKRHADDSCLDSHNKSSELLLIKWKLLPIFLSFRQEHLGFGLKRLQGSEVTAFTLRRLFISIEQIRHCRPLRNASNVTFWTAMMQQACSAHISLFNCGSAVVRPLRRNLELYRNQT